VLAHCTIQVALSDAQAQLINLGLVNATDAKPEAQLLLQHVLNVNRAWLIAHENDVIDEQLNGFLQTLVARRIQGEPMAYILGAQEFYGLHFKVTPDTLIPRPDTETLVEAALAKIPSDTLCKIVDLGTGSGAIALSIAKHRPNAQVLAVDFSTQALNVAKQNATDLNIENCDFLQSDWFDAIPPQRFDVIVSNPPYIEAQDAHLKALTFEPLSALASGADGLDDIRRIVQDAIVFLAPQGWLMLEHGYNQAEQVQDLIADVGLVNIETLQDLGGNNRVTIAKHPLIVSTHWD
jgi:release factor glutamine methyltransferase